MYDETTIASLKRTAREVRRILVSTPFGHDSGNLSMTEIATALYFYKMNHDPENPDWEERDRLILGKAHCAGTLYACLALAGYFPKERYLPLYGGKINWPDAEGWRTIFQGHVDRWCTPGIDVSGGSLGQGLGFAAGVAWGALLKAPLDALTGQPVPSYRVYCISGDGECNEGSIWESAMFAGRHKLANLVNIVDYNLFNTSETVSPFLEPFAEKWRSFGWYVAECDGHNLYDVCRVLDSLDTIPDKPKCIIAHTLKGKGVPYLETTHLHSAPVPPEEVDRALTTYLALIPED